MYKRLIKVLAFVMAIVLMTSTFDSASLIGMQKAQAAGGFDNFITRSGDKLMDGTNQFKFISYNVPNLHEVEDPNWHRVDAWEIEDALKSVAQMGGTAIRIMCLSVKKPTDPAGFKRHIYGPDNYDEDMFRDLDKLLQLANQYQVRIIIPFLDNWQWCGGKDEFAGFRGTTDFYGNSAVKQDYKNMINYVLNRTNYYTGVQYKDDKAILAWETGNELSPPDAWTSEMAAYIKSIDSSHLFLDGKYGISSNSLNDANIDIVSNHYYPSSGTTNYASLCNSDMNLARGKKPFIVGEFGNTDTSKFHDLLDAAISNGTAGVLLWSLRFHSKDGGFYIHDEQNSFFSYHWPGFSEGSSYDEKNVVNLIRDHAYEIRGLSVPPVTLPDAPQLLEISSTNSINWRGSAGASAYDVERAVSISGPWTVVGADISDAKDVSRGPLFIDSSAVAGTVYYYRVKAKNTAGVSGASNVIGPVTGAAVNPVLNSGFESGTDSWALESNWAVTTEDKHSGSYSVKLSGTGGWKNITQTVAVARNTNYTLSFWGKCNTNSTVYKVLDASWNSLTGTSKTFNDSMWTRYYLTFNSGDNTQVIIYIGDGGGTCYFDDFEMHVNPVYNPGFEYSIEPWVWSLENNWSRTAASPFAGSNSVKLSGTGSWKNLTQIVSVKPNTNYTFSFWGYCRTTNTVYKVLTEGWQPITADQHTLNNNAWSRYSVTFNSGNNTRVRLNISDGGGTNYFDDFDLQIQ